MSETKQRSYDFCWTDFDIKDALVPEFYPEDWGWDYLVYSLEYCPDTGKPHYQA